jgi:hypothetical protein
LYETRVSSWYASAETVFAIPQKDQWLEILGLLGVSWHPLAQGLRNADIPVPDEVDWDWVEAGKVSGKRALMMWSTLGGPVVLVDSMAGIVPSPNVVAAEPNSTATAIAAMLRPLLEAIR